ncbi:response regulator transcription factor [Clostridium sp. MSJ-4]|uniref:Stage 0 sporulation protein A homolog n=1 Tax=Clostridium simiarum TaxID=2841506 RepID=A0ABS6F4R6_9CLOT|nr:MULTISPECIES: response regulator transcription factor [Clostridium]MBU5593519.1 response regulator transcription factor [Clostridium simiarum]
MLNNILLIEDDEALSLGIEYALSKEGFKVSVNSNLENARDELNKNNYDLILLDVMLPDGNGYDFCREIRGKSNIPIIFLTACDDEVNIVLGLDIGGDDYIIKPFRVKELLSRIKAVLRRKSYDKEEKEKDIIKSSDLVVDVKQAKVFKGGEEISLTSVEYKLLLYFMKNSKQVLTRNQMFEQLWDVYGEFVDNNTLSVYVRRLREKVEDNPSEPKLILTLRGLGYKWDSEIL